MLGTHQDVAREALGHELALIGVPPPTTLDGFRPANGDEMKNFMISVGLSPEQGEEIAGKLKSSLTITSIVQFGWWFQEHSFKDWFHSHEEWRKNAPLFVAMTWALKTCDSMSHAKKKCEEQLRDDDKVPMDPILNQSLNEAWNKLYHVPLPPSQELTSQILDRMYRELKNRSGEAKPVEGLYTKENILSIGQEERERPKEKDLRNKIRPDRQDSAGQLSVKQGLTWSKTTRRATQQSTLTESQSRNI